MTHSNPSSNVSPEHGRSGPRSGLEFTQVVGFLKVTFHFYTTCVRPRCARDPFPPCPHERLTCATFFPNPFANLRRSTATQARIPQHRSCAFPRPVSAGSLWLRPFQLSGHLPFGFAPTLVPAKREEAFDLFRKMTLVAPFLALSGPPASGRLQPCFRRRVQNRSVYFGK